jgi:hypothetical protein
MWVVYEIKTETNDFGLGADATEIAFIDPRSFKDSDNRGERLTYKFCVDMDAEII